ncbi:MAG: RNA polymerase sporulation sigma factor SigK [Lachnospiraceae bacterium]|nr:RNA polymerase sporulation sigma factor SigK [Lachnospiraceae bacterium]
MKTFPRPLTVGEEKAYLERLEQGDPEARRVLIERNLRLVAHVAKKYNFPEREMEDMISIGTIGLIKAVDSYRLGKGSRLATYAAKCIENEILMTLRSDRKYRKDVSMFDPIGTDKEGNEIQLVDIMESQETDIVETLYFTDTLERLQRSMPQILTETEYRILTMRYGMGRREGVTQKEVAKSLGISRSYVSRIEKRALGKCRRYLAETPSGLSKDAWPRI